MKRIVDGELALILPFFQAAAAEARDATCRRAKCGSVLVRGGVIVGRGHNGPPGDDESNRMCNVELDLTLRPKNDKTCCIHAEVAAVLDGMRRNANHIVRSRLYFMRVGASGDFTEADAPYCTLCSRFVLAAGVAEFALWNAGGADVYDLPEYNRLSYDFYRPG